MTALRKIVHLLSLVLPDGINHVDNFLVTALASIRISVVCIFTSSQSLFLGMKNFFLPIFGSASHPAASCRSNM
jgi:hypothetical protein